METPTVVSFPDGQRSTILSAHMKSLEEGIQASRTTGTTIPSVHELMNQSTKQVLHDLTGFAKPGQVMAIMGASGSGKTSFLNILGQRLGLSPGSKMSG